MLTELSIVLLCLVPFIENRGAMFIGFAAGVTDPTFYILGTALEFLQTAAYLEWLPIKKLGLFKRVEHQLEKRGPMLFVPLLVLPSNGINSFTGSLLSRAVGFDRPHALAAICAGIIARGLTTYLLLYGAWAASDALAIESWFQAAMWLMLAYFAFNAAKDWWVDGCAKLFKRPSSK